MLNVTSVLYTKLDQYVHKDLHHTRNFDISFSKLCQTQSSSQMEDANARFLQICEASSAK